MSKGERKQKRHHDKALQIEQSEEKKPSREEWSSWERKVEQVSARDYARIAKGWLAHMPNIAVTGSPPLEGFDSIDAMIMEFPKAGTRGAHVDSLDGARPVVLHEAFYLAHKAVHVEISCADAINKGRHTWAIVNAYQGSLFAMCSVLAFLGISLGRDRDHHMLLDVWTTERPGRNNRPRDLDTGEVYQLVRFKGLDHYQKWALLKRALRTLTCDIPLAQAICDALNGNKNKAFAKYRNEVQYVPTGWLSDDLLVDVVDGPVTQARSFQEVFDEIYAGSAKGSVYLLVALIELACALAEKLSISRVARDELSVLARRTVAASSICDFAWPTDPVRTYL